MRVVHIVTYVSEDGAFGGPVAVAVAHATELARRGHDVQLLAGWDGVASLEVPGVHVRLFAARAALPVGGFSRLVSPRLVRYFLQNRRKFDVVHVHLARDLVTLPVALLAAWSGIRLILQPHGMVMPDRRSRARVFDVAIRWLLCRADRVLVLTPQEQDGIETVARMTVRSLLITNGVDTSLAAAFAASPPRLPGDSAEVLFLARLHPRKRVTAFVEMAAILHRRGIAARFTVVGPDEGELASMRRMIAEFELEGVVVYEGALALGNSVERMLPADVYVLPSFGEIVPMSVLEAMSAALPVVITHDCGLADSLAANEAAAVTDGSPQQLADAVERFLTDSEYRHRTVSRATRLLGVEYSIAAVVDVLEKIYRESTV